jgi:hypothetical protein
LPVDIIRALRLQLKLPWLVSIIAAARQLNLLADVVRNGSHCHDLIDQEPERRSSQHCRCYAEHGQ